MKKILTVLSLSVVVTLGALRVQPLNSAQEYAVIVAGVTTDELLADETLRSVHPDCTFGMKRYAEQARIVQMRVLSGFSQDEAYTYLQQHPWYWFADAAELLAFERSIVRRDPALQKQSIVALRTTLRCDGRLTVPLCGPYRETERDGDRELTLIAVDMLARDSTYTYLVSCYLRE
jgi:hypothetical protein